MSLKVIVKNATDLPNFETIGKIDPLVVMKFRGLEKATKTIDDNLNPEWNENFEWTLQAALDPSEILKIEVYDYEKLRGNRLVGSYDYAVNQLWGKKEKSESLQLVPSKKAKSVKNWDKHRLNLSLSYIPLKEPGGGGGKKSDKTSGDNGSSGDSGSSGYGGSSDGDDVDWVGGNESGGGGGGRKRRARHPKLPDKPMDFQIIAHILEGRKLEGNNISPIVKVSCGNEFHKTSSRKGTNNPVFDETVIFSFKERPVELFEKNIEIKVMDTGKKFRDSALGIFTIDVGTIYYEPEHSFIHKWLLLTDAEDSSLGAKGFLKVSLSVLGPEDDPITSPSEISQDDVDIESNLLRPSGVRLQPATTTVKIYSAEDLPQMDPGYFEKFKSILSIGSGQKELVDPFAVIAYAGHEEKTEVKWNTQRPEWNQQINIGFRFPSMCQRVRIQVKDKDKLNADDYIATCFININEVSASGEHGFLPTFGPCFVNLYGSLREFTDLPDKYEELNKGLLEGVAYRGRVLLELETSLDGLPEQKIESISDSHIRRLQSFQRREKYVLVAMLQSATMIQSGNDTVEFEISIGNYGNKGEKSSLVQTSTTQSINPVYDGTAYSYVPWTHNKPCIVIESYWENCSYRISVMNLLDNIANKLEDEINGTRRLLRLPKKFQELVDERLSELCSNLLEELIGCHMSMPKLPTDSGYTKLDKYLRQYRIKELGYLCDMIDGISKSDITETDQRLDELQVVLERLRCLATEPQNSIPDVIIWMLVKGKRIASCRVPSHSIMYSSLSATKGKLCGKQITLQLHPPCLNKEKDLDGNKKSCLLQLNLWLGLNDERDNLLSDSDRPGGELITYAETYENQAFYGIWGSGRKLTRPGWSNASGKTKLKKSYFEPPPYGWDWDGQWFVEDMSAEVVTEDLLTIDVFEVQSRQPLDVWPEMDKSIWAEDTGTALLSFDSKGNEFLMTRKNIDDEIPRGWKWINEWQIDINGSVASDGWEYSTMRYDRDEGFVQGAEFAPTERTEHVTRRRKLYRTRKRIEETSIKTETKSDDEKWMYARHPNASYHSNKQRLDFFRRRKWRRPLKCVIQGYPAIFRLIRDRDRSKSTASESESEDQPDGEGGRLLAPQMYLTFEPDEYTSYQLRAYIYQARSLYGADSTGLSDPYCVVSCGNTSGRTRVVEATLSPKWSQTLVLNGIRQYGSPRTVLASPPLVVIELYDKDTIGQNEYIGMVKVKPDVKMTVGTDDSVLEWLPITRYNKPAGELLAAFELIRDGVEPSRLQHHPDGHYDIPEHIKPDTEKMRVEVLCWGVRDMQRYQLLPVDHPMVQVEVGGEVKESGYIVNPKKNPMFPVPIVILDVELPIEEVYSPPLNIRVYDKRKFGYAPLVGQCTIASLKDYEQKMAIEESTSLTRKNTTSLINLSKQNEEESLKLGEISIDIASTAEEDAMSIDEFDEKCTFDWWSKYYASTEEHERVQEGYLADNHDKMKVYPKELENEFNHFSDLAQTFKLFRGKGQQQQDDDSALSCGDFKGSLKIYPVPLDSKPSNKFSTSLPIKWPMEVVVRVYVIRGFNLAPRDIGGSSDPYIKVAVGKKEISDKENFIANQLNPLFGRVFELDALLPFDRTLTVTIMDHDYLSADDIIGYTTVDLENRFLSLHRPLCGVPETFSKSGPNRWRDYAKPVEILETLCKLRGFDPLEWDGTSKVKFHNHTYCLSDFETAPPNKYCGSEDHRLALHILKLQNFVPEHIEKRTLFNSVQPGVPQGHLHMWVDMFPKLPNVSIPPKVPITARSAEQFVLRVVIWNTVDVILDERNPVSGDSMSDIYVKGWFTGSDDVQKTDVHYRSLDGEGNFNWRLVYPFDYIPQEQKMLIKTKKHLFSLDKTVSRLPVRFNLQVWDNDLLSADDFLGKVEFDLHNMPIPSKTKRRCRLRILDDHGQYFKRMDLFQQKHVKGWIPVYQENYTGPERREQRDNKTVTGKIEVEFEILTESEAKLRPAGKARDKPNQNPVLEDPDRPELSFAWFASPLKTFKFMIWRPHKCKFIFGIVFFLVLICFVLIL